MIYYHISLLSNLPSILQDGIVAGGYGQNGLGKSDNKFVYLATDVDLILEHIGIRYDYSKYSVFIIDLPEHLIHDTGYWDWEKLVKDKIPPEFIRDFKGLESYV